MKKLICTLLCGGLLLTALSGCAERDVTSVSSTETESVSVSSAETDSSQTDSEMFTDRDYETDYDESSSVTIQLNGDSAAASSDSVQISGSTITITEEATYVLSGTLDDGMIIVDASDTAKIHLVLDGANINSESSAAFYILEADKVFVTLADGTENILSNGGTFTAIDDNNIDGALFSKQDLTLNGSGTLTVTSPAGHGIVCKDDLVITGGSYTVTSASHGLDANDSIRITGDSSFTVDAGKDGLHAENTDDTSLGFLYVSGGTFTITADGDGMSASAYLRIEDGTFNITTGEGSASVTMTTDTADFGKRDNVQMEATTTTEEEDSVSQKGIKADGSITIVGGNFVTDTEDDSIHAGGDILISNGEFELRSGDDAIHSDAAVAIQNGTFIIAYCYEGIEGLSITLDDGTFDITSVDDGINAAGGTDSSGFGGGRPGEDQFSASSDSFITINGGSFIIVSTGDCIDSNGAFTVNGGTLDLTCNGGGNTAIDCSGTYTNNGGDVTTNDGSDNDGSESSPGHKMGGGMGQGRGGH